METTSDKILTASITLFSEKGYDAVTTKEIAKAAGISEMTVFRHFENKRNLFERAMERFVFFPRFRQLFENNLSWDLEQDLLKISNAYQDTLIQNRNIILLLFKSNELSSEHNAPLEKFPNELKRYLVNYFIQMQEKGFIEGDPEILALSFLSTNFGLFMTFLLMKKMTTDKDIKDYILHNVKIFTRGITS